MEKDRILPLSIALGLLFLAALLVLGHFTRISVLVVVGLALIILCLYSVLRAFITPVAAHKSLRLGKILLALPVGIFGAGALLAAWHATFRYAPWTILLALLLFLGVSRPYVRRLPRREAQAEGERTLER
jgi:hypothetical protein